MWLNIFICCSGAPDIEQVEIRKLNQNILLLEFLIACAVIYKTFISFSPVNNHLLDLLFEIKLKYIIGWTSIMCCTYMKTVHKNNQCKNVSLEPWYRWCENSLNNNNQLS